MLAYNVGNMVRKELRSTLISRYTTLNAGEELHIHLNPFGAILHVELNPPTRIAVLKLPDSFYNPRLFTTKISDYEKEIGFYYC
jgi:hypothetical protein